MDELNNKLNSEDPIIILQVITKMVKLLKGHPEKDILETAEFKFLRDKCVSNNNAVNIVAAEGILQIVRDGDNSWIKSLITDLISIITTTKCSANVAFLMNKLLLMDLENQLSTNECFKSGFNLRVPQHPFIIMLNEDIDCWTFILKEIVYSYRTADESVIAHYDQLYKPVFLYTLCSPQRTALLPFRQKLWTFLINKEVAFKTNNCITCLLAWMQFENKDAIQINSDFLIELFQFNIINPELLLLWQVSALHQLMTNNHDPRGIIFSIHSSLDDFSDTIIFHPILFILSKCILLCQSVYLLQLLKLCKAILSKTKCDANTRSILKASLLQWIVNPSDLISECISYAHNLFSILQSDKTSACPQGFKNFTETFQKLINTNTEVYLSLETYVLMESWRNEQDIINWLEKLQRAPNFFKMKMLNLLIGLFLMDLEQTITTKVFELILKCVEYKTSSNILTVILFKLTNLKDSELHYRLLKAIPKMAVAKNNLQKIVNTIQALHKGRGTLKTFMTTLMLDLWKIDNKCYPHLERLLIAPFDNQGSKWEFYVTKAYVLKELCAIKPELYGKEIVAHLSNILNECSDGDGAVSCSLAIDGITLLCKSEIIDAVTTWATLEPMLKNESRIPVIKSLCYLISEIPSLAYSEAYPKLIEDVVRKLWDYLVLNPNDEVWKSVLEALTHFSLEQIVSQTPDEYFDEETLNLRNSGHVVPGNCWIHFLKNCTESKLQIAGDFLIKLTALEISNYLKFVYQIKGTREPENYSYLPLNSVVRGLSTYIKSQASKWKGGIYEKVYLQCLRIFSQEYSKPLPPLDWCFLQELFHEPETKDFCVDIAAHQVVLSGTARRFVVNYIEASTENYENEKDVLLIYQNLKHLANSIQPITLRPFFEVTIRDAVERFKIGSDELLRNILERLKDTLKNRDVQDANKIVVAEILGEIFTKADISSKLFEVVLECAVEFPKSCVDNLSMFKSNKEVTTEWFKKAIKLRSKLAINSSLNVLNELMENATSFPELRPFIFEHFAVVFEHHQDNTDSVLWFLELIGQIQATTAEKSEFKEILFLCDVLILATVVFSGHSVFLKSFTDTEEMYKLFPRAIATLLEVNHWSICTTQTLEWFDHMNTEKMFSKADKEMFFRCLQALRHETEFYKNMKWTKYLNIECY